MKRLLLGSFLAASLTSPALAGKEVTIVSRGSSGTPCSLAFDDPTLAIAWTRVVMGEMDPDLYMQLYKLEMPNDPDAWVNAQKIVDTCMGAGL